jgi:hypothetical protein
MERISLYRSVLILHSMTLICDIFSGFKSWPVSLLFESLFLTLFHHLCVPIQKDFWHALIAPIVYCLVLMWQATLSQHCWPCSEFFPFVCWDLKTLCVFDPCVCECILSNTIYFCVFPGSSHGMVKQLLHVSIMSIRFVVAFSCKAILTFCPSLLTLQWSFVSRKDFSKVDTLWCISWSLTPFGCFDIERRSHFVVIVLWAFSSLE